LEIIYLHHNSGRFFKGSPTEDDSFFTYGFPGKSAQLIKKYYPAYHIEVWRLSCSSRKYYQKSINNITYKVFPSFQIRGVIDISFRALRELKKCTKENDSILYLSSLHYGLTYLLAFLKRNYKIVVQDYGEYPPKFKLNNSKGLRKLFLYLQIKIEKSLFKKIDMICPGDVNKIPYIIETDQTARYCFVHPLGINMTCFPQIPKSEAKQLLDWDSNKKYILYVGRLDEVKHVDKLVKIWLEIKELDKNVELVFIGGMSNDKFYNLSRESGVLLYPRMLNEELYKYYCAADVYVLMGLENIKFGGIGIAVTESLACGTPVVSSNLRNFLGKDTDRIGEKPVSIQEHKAAIIKVLNNPLNYSECRKAIEDYYSEKPVAKKLNNIFLSLFS
jgi:glycosyltransferase involved in cell wall biosynthesis